MTTRHNLPLGISFNEVLKKCRTFTRARLRTARDLKELPPQNQLYNFDVVFIAREYIEDNTSAPHHTEERDYVPSILARIIADPDNLTERMFPLHERKTPEGKAYWDAVYLERVPKSDWVPRIENMLAQFVIRNQKGE